MWYRSHCKFSANLLAFAVQGGALVHHNTVPLCTVLTVSLKSECLVSMVIILSLRIMAPDTANPLHWFSLEPSSLAQVNVVFHRNNWYMFPVLELF